MPQPPDPTSAAPRPEDSKYPGFFIVFPSIMLSMFLAVVDQTIVATALPAIAAATNDAEHTPWIVVSYLIAATVAAPIYGKLGDAFGRRRLMFVALTVMMGASLLCAASPTVMTLTAARVLQGLGGGGLMTLSQALIGEAIPPRERARYQGYIATVAVCANSFGPVAGGYLTEHFGWQSIFLINLPIGLVALALTTRLPVRATPRTEWRSDPIGLVLFAVFVAATLFSLEQIQRANSAALPFAASLLGLGVVALVLLIRQENRAPSPLIPLGLLRQPAIWRSDALAACHGAALVSQITFLPVFLHVVHGASPSTVGLLLVPLTVGLGAGSLITGRLVAKTGRTFIFPIFGLVMVTANLVAFAVWAADLGVGAIAGLLLWNGLFMGTVMGVVQVSVQSAAGSVRLGEAAASVQFSRSIGAALGTALIGTVLFVALSLRNPEVVPVFTAILEHGPGAAPALPAAQQAASQADIREAFRIAFLSIAAFAAIGFFLALTNPMRRI